MPRELDVIEGNNDSQRERGESGVVSGGVFDHGTHEEDGPVAWEALASPRPIPVFRRAGEWSPTHGTLRAPASSALWGTAQAPASREATDEGNRSRGRRGQGVGGLHTSEDVGEQGDPWTRPSKGGPCWCDLLEGPMSNAVTL